MKGSLEKREGKRGVTWYGRYAFVDPVTGQRVHKRVHDRNKKVCEQKLRDAITETESGGPIIDETKTVADLFNRWLPTLANGTSVRLTTWRRYNDLYRLHIAPEIGHVRLSQLRPVHLDDLYARKSETLSPTTVQHIHGVIHGALRQAMRWEMVNRNVADLASKPKRRKVEFDTWSPDEIGKLLNAAERSDTLAILTISLTCGLRRGEILGMMWKDIDLDRGTVSIQRSLSRGHDNQMVLSEPKSAAGRRSIQLTQTSIAALRRHRVQQNTERLAMGNTWQDLGFVFTNETGGPMRIKTLMTRYEQTIVAAGVKRIRFHDMRHTCATLMLSENVHPKIAQDRLGHSSVAMTLDRYSHITATMQQEAADLLDSIITKAQESQVS